MADLTPAEREVAKILYRDFNETPDSLGLADFADTAHVIVAVVTPIIRGEVAEEIAGTFDAMAALAEGRGDGWHMKLNQSSATIVRHVVAQRSAEAARRSDLASSHVSEHDGERGGS